MADFRGKSAACIDANVDHGHTEPAAERRGMAEARWKSRTFMIQPHMPLRDSRGFFLGIDIGSTTIKAVLIDEQQQVHDWFYQRTKPIERSQPSCGGQCGACGTCNLGAIRETVRDFLAGAGVMTPNVLCTVVTGSQIVEDTRRFLHYDAHVERDLGPRRRRPASHPDCGAILDVGGQDSKAMIFNAQMQMWVSKMSGICAAGTGAFLDSVAAKLGMSVEEMAEKVNYDSELEFSSVCAVLGATSVNKFKNRFPLGDIIAGACRAQARTIISGVGQIFHNYQGDILFQGGVASNPAVAFYLGQITGNAIVVPELHRVRGALGAACLARQYFAAKDTLKPRPQRPQEPTLESVAMRATVTRRDFFSKSDAPLVWRNLFFPVEILNAMGLRCLTLETYAALFARNQKRVREAFDNAAGKGFSAETCSFLRVLEGMELPPPAFAVSTSPPCQQGERVFQDLARSYGFEDRLYSLPTPATNDEKTVENLAADLEEAVRRMEKATGRKMEPQRLAEACRLSNDAQAWPMECNFLRLTNPPLVRGSVALYFANVFSQLWGRQELVDIQRKFLDELNQARDRLDPLLQLDDTHRIGWLHLPPFYDTKLLDYIELHCQAADRVGGSQFRRLGGSRSARPYRSLARKILTVGFLDPQRRVMGIRDAIVFGRFNGCILYNHGFGRCSMSDSCFMATSRRTAAGRRAAAAARRRLHGFDDRPLFDLHQDRRLRRSPEHAAVRQPLRAGRRVPGQRPGSAAPPRGPGDVAPPAPLLGRAECSRSRRDLTATCVLGPPSGRQSPQPESGLRTGERLK